MFSCPNPNPNPDTITSGSTPKWEVDPATAEELRPIRSLDDIRAADDATPAAEDIRASSAAAAAAGLRQEQEQRMEPAYDAPDPVRSQTARKQRNAVRPPTNLDAV